MNLKLGFLAALLHLSKENFVQGDKNVQGTDVQEYFRPRRLFSKQAFTSDKLAQIIFSIFPWIIRY